MQTERWGGGGEREGRKDDDIIEHCENVQRHKFVCFLIKRRGNYIYFAFYSCMCRRARMVWGSGKKKDFLFSFDSTL